MANDFLFLNCNNSYNNCPYVLCVWIFMFVYFKRKTEQQFFNDLFQSYYDFFKVN